MPAGLEVLIHAPREHHDEILREGVLPLAQDLESTSDVEALFFARYNKPDWNLKLTLLCASAQAVPSCRERVLAMVRDLRDRGLARDEETLAYLPDLEPYGGEHGMRLAERIFHHDSQACLAFLDLEARGRLARSRREVSLLLTERYLDLLEFSREQRIAFYGFSYSWAVDLGVWQAEEREILDRKYATLAPGLSELLLDPHRDSPELWGGEEAAEIAKRLLTALTPLAQEVRRGLAQGWIARDPITLAWSLTHLHANRLQIEAYGEAILRYLMQRFHETA
jgi:thiopeptide-type bacteriocin biosynthesis protein